MILLIDKSRFRVYNNFNKGKQQIKKMESLKMTYNYKLKDENGNIDYIGTFSPLEIGMVIGWGHDETEPDGIRKWEVIAQI